MRVAPPDVVTVTDGRGRVARGAAARVDGGALVVEVLESQTHRRPRPELVVYQGGAKGHKNDEVVERLAELGVAEVRVFESNRSVARWDESKVARLTERWSAITRSAAKQSRNPFVTEAVAGVSWTQVVREVGREQVGIVLWEEASLPLRTALVEGAERIALVVGPEGGLEPAEAEALADAGAQLVSLGPHVLRTENAALVAASAVLFAYGVIG